ncbi:MAG: YgfZ/GcvT domain-containing protein [Mycobacteriales bacterium]
MTYRSPLLDHPGAVPADEPDAAVAWHYGDPMREQRALATSAGWVDRSHRGVLTVSGDDRLTWLHSLTSQHLAQLPDGAASEALVLDPHGHVEHHVQLADVGGTVTLDVEPGTVTALAAYLDSMRFWSKVEVTDESDRVAVLSIVGPETAAAIGAVGAVPPSAGRAVAFDGGLVRRMSWPGVDAADLLIERSRVAGVVGRLTDAGVEAAGSWAFEALRVADRRPRLGFETDHRTIPHELGWIGPAVHLDKGCYRGQETVARVQNLGRPPRRMVLVHLDGSGNRLPKHGAAVEVGAREVGFVGTAVWHHELGPVALAVIKRNVADDAVIDIGGIPAAIDA